MGKYKINNREFYRVTSILGGLECEAVAWNVRYGKGEELLANSVTLPGSLMHWKIEKFMREKAGLGPPEPLTWGPGTEDIYRKWCEEGVEQERLIMPANEGFDGFLQFFKSMEWVDEDGVRHDGIIPVLIEQTMFVDDFHGTGIPVAGTADLIARVRLKGKVGEDGYFHECTHIQPFDPLCDCTYQWVVTVMDWKYSVNKQSSHAEQLSAYHYMAKVTGQFDIATENGKYPINFENWSVLFKRPNHAVGYTLYKYPYDIKPFLYALEILKHPRFISLSHRNFKTGLHGRCMFCPYANNCPERVVYSSDEVVDLDAKRGLMLEAKYD